MLRFWCTARDRYRLYSTAQRFAAAGGIVICERYPTPQDRLLVGPGIARRLGTGSHGRIADRLIAAETRYHDRILPPDTLIVLRLDPELAVRRKTDEPEDYVRRRAMIIWETDWTKTRAHVVDAGRPLDEVVSDLMRIIWAEV